MHTFWFVIITVAQICISCMIICHAQTSLGNDKRKTFANSEQLGVKAFNIITHLFKEFQIMNHYPAVMEVLI